MGWGVEKLFFFLFEVPILKFLILISIHHNTLQPNRHNLRLLNQNMLRRTLLFRLMPYRLKIIRHLQLTIIGKEGVFMLRFFDFKLRA